MTPRAPHAHVLVRVPPDDVLLIRRIRNGRVYYVAPGVAIAEGETPGAAAARAARDVLGIEADIEDVLHAEAFTGVDHFFFTATAGAGAPGTAPVLDHDDYELDGELGGSYELVRLRVGELLGYDVRPWTLAQRVVRAS